MEKEKVIRYLRLYEKDPGDDLVGEVELPDIDLREMQMIYGVDQNNPMFDCWRVEKHHNEFLEKYINIRVDFERYDYFIEADAE